MKKSDKKGKILIGAGTVLLVAALLLVAYNLYSLKKAGRTSEAMLSALAIPAVTGDATPDYVLNPAKEMPRQEVEGVACVATVEIPALELKLPVAAEWSYPNLKKCPCRYYGSPYTKNMIIAAHNYSTHFGRLSKLQEGDAVIVTDMDGNIFHYEVIVVDVLVPTAIEEMKAGAWNLTLFTCTPGNSYRVTVRCREIQ